MSVEMLVGVFAMFVRAKSAMRVSVELSLILDGLCGLVGGVLYRPVVMIVSVRMVRGSWAVVEVQSHAKTGVELRVVGGFYKAQVRGSPAE
jgi:hypothetical protein